MCYNYIGGSLFTRSRTYSLFHALIHLFTYPVISPSLNLSLISPLRHSDSHLFRHIVTRSLNSTLIHSLVHTLIHSLSQSLIHSHNKFLESYQRKLNGTTTLLGSNFKQYCLLQFGSRWVQIGFKFDSRQLQSCLKVASDLRQIIFACHVQANFSLVIFSRRTMMCLP